MIPDKSRESYDVRTRCKKNGCQPHAVLASSASLQSRNYLLSTIKDIHFWVSIKSRNEAIPLVNFPTPAQQHNYIARRWVMRLLLNVSLQYEFDNTKEAKASPCRCGLIKNILLSLLGLSVFPSASTTEINFFLFLKFRALHCMPPTITFSTLLILNSLI
jgi:hypothetical protein